MSAIEENELFVAWNKLHILRKLANEAKVVTHKRVRKQWYIKQGEQGTKQKQVCIFCNELFNSLYLQYTHTHECYKNPNAINPVRKKPEVKVKRKICPYCDKDYNYLYLYKHKTTCKSNSKNIT